LGEEPSRAASVCHRMYVILAADDDSSFSDEKFAETFEDFEVAIERSYRVASSMQERN
jgi:hypothetical protein